MTDYAKKSEQCRDLVEKHRHRADNFAGLNVAAVAVTAILAGVAAVTSATSLPTWVVTVSAGLSAALGVLTAKYDLRRKNVSHAELAVDFDRLATRYDQLVGLDDSEVHADWLQKLEKIESDLHLKESKWEMPLVDEATWAAASRPAMTRA